MHGQVQSVTQITPRMVRVVLGGSGLDSFEASEASDQYISVLIPPEGASYAAPFDADAELEPRPARRRYTMRAWDPALRLMTVDFVIHGDVGAAGRWANNAKVGDFVEISGPAGSYSPNPEADWYLMAGDESTIPAIAASLERVLPGKRAVAVLLVDNAEHELELTSPGDLEVRWVHRDADPSGRGLFLEEIEGLVFGDGLVDVFVHGEATEVRAIRKHLFGERAITREGSSISPYWRRDFTDEKWREVKRDWLAEVALDV